MRSHGRLAGAGVRDRLTWQFEGTAQKPRWGPTRVTWYISLQRAVRMEMCDAASFPGRRQPADFSGKLNNSHAAQVRGY